MPNREGTVEILAQELGLALAPLNEQLAAGAYSLFETLGLRLPPGFIAAGDLATALGQGATAATHLPDRVSALETAIEANHLASIVSASAQLMGVIRDVLQAIAQIADALHKLGASFAGLSPSDRAAVQTFAEQLPVRLLHRLLVDYLEAKFPAATAGLVLAGLIDREQDPGVPTNPLRPPYLRKAVRFDRLLDLITHPDRYVRDVYKWGAPDFDGVRLFRAIRDFLDAELYLPSMVLTPPGMPASLEAFFFALRVDPRPAPAPPGLVLDLRFPAVHDVKRTHLVSEAWQLDLNAHARFVEDVSANISPPLHFDLKPPRGTVELALTVGISRIAAAGPLLLLGQAGGARLEIGEPSLSLGAQAHWASGGASLEPTVGGALKRGKLVLTGQGGDGLIDEVLSGMDIEADFDVELSFSPSQGLRFQGGAGLAIDLKADKQLGPLRLDTLHLALGLAGAGLQIDLGVTLDAKLGPVTASVQNMGARGRLSFPGQGGNLGPVQLDLGFKLPTGVGLSMDTAAVKLGGFLVIDPDNHRYAGAVELRILDFFDLSAIGIINTRLPDGSDTFSLLILITTKLPVPIHLGYNFFLTGVGGMLGLHRSVDLDYLRRTLRDGTADDILFPKDVVENMESIVSGLGHVFPPTRGQFIVGPMAQITWNTPPLLRIELGVIIEFGGSVRIAILGKMRAAIPTEDAPIIDIKVGFLGSIDFDKALLAFDASVYDSHVGISPFGVSFEGDMALRLSWGRQKDFVLSVGGFHPQYEVPSFLELPPMRRVTVSLLRGNPRLTLTAYFAVTTNTVQFGAALDFYYGWSWFNVAGYFSFDALFQFSPFRFIVGVRAGIALRSGDSDLFAIRLDFELQGTTPWIARGSASFTILFFEFSVDFEKTWGERRDINLPEVQVLPALLTEFARETNWKAQLAAGASQLAQLSVEAQRADAMLVDPAGVLTISQSLVPLATDFSRFGNNRPADIKRADIAAVRVGSRTMALADVEDGFAPAAFREMSDRDKLAASSYEPRKSGVAARGGEDLVGDYLITRPVAYEVVVSDAPPSGAAPPVKRSTLAARRATFEPLVPGGTIGRSKLSRMRAVEKQARSVLQIDATEEKFAVVSRRTLRAEGGSAPLSRTAAEARLHDLTNTDNSTDDFEIVPVYLVAA